MAQHKIFPNDIKYLTESMQELFNESDKVTPKQLAERMSLKCGRLVDYHFASYIFTFLGFVTSASRGELIVAERYIVKNQELLDQLKKDLPNIEARSQIQSPTQSPYSIKRSSAQVFRPNRINP